MQLWDHAAIDGQQRTKQSKKLTGACELQRADKLYQSPSALARTVTGQNSTGMPSDVNIGRSEIAHVLNEVIRTLHKERAQSGVGPALHAPHNLLKQCVYVGYVSMCPRHQSCTMTHMSRQDNWDDLRPAAEFAVDNAFQESIQDTPFYLNHTCERCCCHCRSCSSNMPRNSWSSSLQWGPSSCTLTKRPEGNTCNIYRTCCRTCIHTIDSGTHSLTTHSPSYTHSVCQSDTYPHKHLVTPLTDSLTHSMIECNLQARVRSSSDILA